MISGNTEQSALYQNIQEELEKNSSERNSSQKSGGSICTNNRACGSTSATQATGLDDNNSTRSRQSSIKRIRTRRLLSQRDVIRRCSTQEQFHLKVQVYPKSSYCYVSYGQSTLTHQGSKKRKSSRTYVRRNSTISAKNSGDRRNAVVGGISCSQRKAKSKRTRSCKKTVKPNLDSNKATVQIQQKSNCIKGAEKFHKKIDNRLILSQASLKGCSTEESSDCSDGGNRSREKMKSSSPISSPMTIGSPMAVEKKSMAEVLASLKLQDNRPNASPPLGRFKPQLPIFLSTKSGSPPSSKKGFGKRVGSPGTPPSRRSFPDEVSLGSRGMWKMQEPYIWCNLNGQRVEIAEVDLLSLSESECIALQKVAEQKLREIDLGVSITVPKDESKLLHGKNNSMLRRAGVHLPLGGTKNKSKKDQDHVFSIPLVRVVENDQLLRLQTVEQDEDAFCGATNSGNDDDSAGRSSSEGSPKTTRRMSSSQDSCADQSSSGSMPSTFEKSEQKTSSPSTPPSGSPLTTRKQPGSRTLRRRGAVGLNNDTEIDDVNIKLLESLSISETKDKKRSLLPPTMPQVPYVVQKCCAHILKHGLDVTGIFRIAGSKKRVRQLREEFDHGVDVKIDENYHAHDVAALLKEFFRDLPEALLSRELYQAFISTAKLPQYQRLDALRSLVWLLPMPNRDTLQQLLSFLATVAEFSEDRVDPSGKTMGGNKMSVANLSVIFGPNILHRFKKNQSNNDTQYQVQSLERAEESTYVIKIVDDMIRSQRDLFMIPRETHDEILRTLQESDPDAVDFLLRRKAANYARSPSPKVMNDRVTSPVEEPMKRFIMGCEEMIPDRSDMNNNNKNNSSNSTIQKDLHDTRRGKQDHQSASKASTVTKLQKTSFDNNPIPDESSNQPPTYSHGNGSVTFTEEDLKDILQGDWSRTNNISRNKTGMAEKTGQSLDKNSLDLPLQTTSHSPQTNRRTSALLITTDLRHRHPATAFKTEYPRHHGLSLATKQAYIDKEEQNKSSSSRSPTVTSNNKKFRPHILQSVVSSKPGSTTPGFEDTSSTSSGSVISNRPPTPKQKKHNRINFDSNGVEMNRPSTESRQRRRQPSALTLSLHRRHETNSSNGHPLHSVRLPKQTEKKNSPDEENVVELADLEPRSYHRGRRVSKDDLYLTQQEFRRRLERQRSIMI